MRLPGAYDYIIDDDLPRGTLVTAPLGTRDYLGCIWQPADGQVDRSKLKQARPLPGNPCLPPGLCEFIDWVARYTFTSPGLVLALALRSPQAFEPEGTRLAYIRGTLLPSRLTPARERTRPVVPPSRPRRPAWRSAGRTRRPPPGRGADRRRRRSLWQGPAGGPGSARGTAERVALTRHDRNASLSSIATPNRVSERGGNGRGRNCVLRHREAVHEPQVPGAPQRTRRRARPCGAIGVSAAGAARRARCG